MISLDFPERKLCARKFNIAFGLLGGLWNVLKIHFYFIFFIYLQTKF